MSTVYRALSRLVHCLNCACKEGAGDPQTSMARAGSWPGLRERQTRVCGQYNCRDRQRSPEQRSLSVSWEGSVGSWPSPPTAPSTQPLLISSLTEQIFAECLLCDLRLCARSLGSFTEQNTQIPRGPHTLAGEAEYGQYTQ